MLNDKTFVSVLVLCLVHGSLSKPFLNNVIEGRGIGSTLWGWITYPFSWWGSDVNDISPESDHLVGLPDTGSNHNIEIGKHNVTIWCNDQTCTTMKCDRIGCVNVTCNIYDTDLTGECRNYNTALKPEEPTTSQSPDTVSKPEIINNSETETTTKETTTPSTTTTIASTINDNVHGTEERPLQLEAVLSSTVTENTDKEIPTE